MTILFFRTLLTVSLLFLVLRLLGKRQIGELEISELATTLLLSELAALPIENPDVPLAFAAIPILTIATLEVIISHLKNKLESLKGVFESKPVYLIERGEIRQDALLKTRISVNELISECRLQGVGDLSDIDFAILEQNGQLAILLKSEKQPLTSDSASGKESVTMHPVVMDGKTDPESLRLLGIDEGRIKGICRRNHVAISDVFLLTLAENGAYRLIKKEET